MEGGIRIESLLTLAAWKRENERNERSNVAPRTPTNVTPLKDLLNQIDRPQLVPLSLIAPQIHDNGKSMAARPPSNAAAPKSIAVSALLGENASTTKEAANSSNTRLPTLSNITNPPAKPTKSAVPLTEVLNFEDSRSPNLSSVKTTAARRSSVSSSHGRKRRKLSNAELPTPQQAATSAPSSSLTLPKPQPRLAKAGRRNRIPPVISGLHDPPEDARLVPSITTSDGSLRCNLPEAGPRPAPGVADTVRDEHAHPIATATVVTPALVEDRHDSQESHNKIQKDQISASETTADGAAKERDMPEQKSSKSIEAQDESAKRAQAYRPWDDKEHNYLMSGVQRFGIGNWKKILMCPDYHFKDGRTAVDLKDRFRRKHRQTYSSAGKEAVRKRKDEQAKGLSAVKDCSLSVSDKLEPNCNQLPADPDDFGQHANNPETETSSLQHVDLRQLKHSERRGRIPFTSEEDDAILRGYKKYGSQWQKIRIDPELHLKHRGRTDLRDRFRNKWQKELAAHIAKKPLEERDTNEIPKEPSNDRDTKESATISDCEVAANSQGEAVASKQRPSDAAGSSGAPSAPATAISTSSAPKPSPIGQSQHSALPFPFPLLDTDALDSFSVQDDTETEPGNITLSRNIFDWANQNLPSHTNAGSSGLTHLFQPLTTKSIQGTLDQQSVLNVWDNIGAHPLLAFKNSQGAASGSGIHSAPNMSMPAMPIAGMLAEDHDCVSAPSMARSTNAVVSLPGVEDLVMSLDDWS